MEKKPSDVGPDFWKLHFLDSKIHHNNLLNNIMAKIQANVAGKDAGLMLDEKGFVAELNGSNLFITYVSLSIFISFSGYFWFLIKYPALDSGDTIKATYMIQAFHLIGVLSILYLEKLKQKNSHLHTSICL